jgi:hypothetical protein
MYKKIFQNRRCSVVMMFFLGSVLLLIFSFIQKTVLGFDQFALKGFVIPLLFGGITGAIIGNYIWIVLQLNKKLSARVEAFESFVPICANCKRIRKPDSDPKKMDSWEQVETYISRKTSYQLSHSICPDCIKKLYGDNNIL